MWARYSSGSPPERNAQTNPSALSLAIRRTHRSLAILFTSTVIANFAVMMHGKPPGWVVYSPLPFLFLLMFSGLYLFTLPYVSHWRANRHSRQR